MLTFPPGTLCIGWSRCNGLDWCSDLMEVGHLVHIVDEKTCKIGTMNFKICKLIISAFRNKVAELYLHSHSLHRSGEINNTVFQL
jgi:hypothetical protein